MTTKTKEFDVYITKEGDMLDLICFNHYGTTEHTLRVIEFNYDLSKQGIFYKSGIKIKLPKFETTEKINKQNLRDLN